MLGTTTQSIQVRCTGDPGTPLKLEIVRVAAPGDAAGGEAWPVVPAKYIGLRITGLANTPGTVYSANGGATTPQFIANEQIPETGVFQKSYTFRYDLVVINANLLSGQTQSTNAGASVAWGLNISSAGTPVNVEGEPLGGAVSTTFYAAPVSSTCLVTAGNAGTVTMPTVNASALGTIGARAGRALFAINLTGCSDVTGVRAKFTDGNINPAGRLSSTDATTQGKVSLVIMDATSGSDLRLGTDISPLTNINNGKATIGFFAEYYAEAAGVGPGTLSSSVDYELSYP
ncbi:type 1 fimbrial protein [Paraburkholderia sediminicola]|nr:type 1 fimbrial protein [Paraburkholderia sediminicola]